MLQAEFDLPPSRADGSASLANELAKFCEFEKQTTIQEMQYAGSRIPVYINEFWTAKQRSASRLHEISYRACFKPQLPRFFIQRLTNAGDIVFDPFMGRGTTLLEAALLGRMPWGTDINPLARLLITPRLNPPTLEQIAQRLSALDLQSATDLPAELHVFYHPDTLREICSLRDDLLKKEAAGAIDAVDAWIRMVALNRLTGHSPGFFSVYTLPPNQAVSIDSQKRINERLQQTPSYRDVCKIILNKSRQLLADFIPPPFWENLIAHAKILTSPAHSAPELLSDSVTLVVTSPPFLNIVDYKTDNWLRCWFAGLSLESINMSMYRKTSEWQAAMTAALSEMRRILKPGGYIAFEVGEVHKGKVKLEENIVAAGIEAALNPLLIIINAQTFTKTANCWGVNNNSHGTNTNRVVVFQKPI